ncbi:MAG: hypothetical protein ABI343_20850 [Burkholderiaceae bacterium]
MTTVFQAQGDSPVKQYKEPLARPVYWFSLRTLTLIASVSALGLLGCAQTPVGPAADGAPSSAAPGMPMGGQGGSMAQMDAQMKMMRETHDKMMQAKSPEERNALMVTHMKQMQDGMAMMGMGSGGMAGMQGKSPMAGDMAARQQMMEKRMEMMQSMMQMMMMDRMSQAPSKQ